jgi:RNA polymerase sigma-70 factor (ECF subfamily)
MGEPLLEAISMSCSNAPESAPRSHVRLALANTRRPEKAGWIVARDHAELREGLAALVPDLFARALRLAGCRATADDLVQDTIERALRFAAQYEPGTSLRAWAQQILFSVFITRYRRARREKTALRVLAVDPCAWTLPDRFPSPDSATKLTSSVEEHLDALPPGFRSVVMLVDLEQKSYREAAAELGVPVGTVMSRLHRGRKLLATRLAEAA